MNNSDYKPLISVVITTYNRCDKLKRAVNSVLSQTYQPIEIFIVDNASTDKTTDYVKTIADNKIVYIRHGSNFGGPAARNTGIRNAKGEFVAFLDDDDEWFAEKLEKQVEKFSESDTKVGLVYVGSEIYDEQKQKIEKIYHPQYKGQVYQRLLLNTILSSVSSVLVRKQCFEQVGLFDEELKSCQDWDMWLRLAQRFEFDFVDETLVRINMHTEQISTNYASLIPGRTRMVTKHESAFRQYPHIYVTHLKRLGKLHCFNGTYKQAWGFFQKAIAIEPWQILKIGGWCILEWPWKALFSKNRKFKKLTSQANA